MTRSDYGLVHRCLGACDIGRGLANLVDTPRRASRWGALKRLRAVPAATSLVDGLLVSLTNTAQLMSRAPATSEKTTS
ncbi:hypothetical protein E2C01_023602 [Portunus trituberculatus]|uniref:Uncharacterized protein n=1 Tax=Portunus trituberculatus TaxID=210409 RepID=A0A5B7E8D0_PORTR|nr:hypothetical protein [Portunus trituberculatus]